MFYVSNNYLIIKIYTNYASHDLKTDLKSADLTNQMKSIQIYVECNLSRYETVISEKHFMMNYHCFTQISANEVQTLTYQLRATLA